MSTATALPPHTCKPNRFRRGPKGYKSENTSRPISIEDSVPTLTYGPNNNWVDFRKKMIIASGHLYGKLGSENTSRPIFIEDSVPTLIRTE